MSAPARMWNPFSPPLACAEKLFLGESFRRAQKLLVAVVFDDDENGEEKAGKRKGEKGGGGWAR